MTGALRRMLVEEEVRSVLMVCLQICRRLSPACALYNK